MVTLFKLHIINYIFHNHKNSLIDTKSKSNRLLWDAHPDVEQELLTSKLCEENVLLPPICCAYLAQHNNVNTYCLVKSVKSVKSSIFDKMTIALCGQKHNN